MRTCEKGHSYDDAQFPGCPFCYVESVNNGGGVTPIYDVKEVNSGEVLPPSYDTTTILKNQAEQSYGAQAQQPYDSTAAQAYAAAPQQQFYDNSAAQSYGQQSYDVYGTQAQQTAAYQPANAAQPQKAYEALDKNKKKRGWLVALIGLVVIAGTFAALYILLWRDPYVNNKHLEGSDLTIPPGYEVADVMQEGVSFVYPNTYTQAYDMQDGCYIYLDSFGSQYVLVDYVQEHTSPRKYFKEYNKMLKDSYTSVTTSEIAEVMVLDKVLYLERSEIVEGETTYYVDRYLEPYEDAYVQYTVRTTLPGAGDDVMFRIISSLYTSTHVYTNYADD